MTAVYQQTAWQHSFQLVLQFLRPICNLPWQGVRVLYSEAVASKTTQIVLCAALSAANLFNTVAANAARTCFGCNLYGLASTAAVSTIVDMYRVCVKTWSKKKHADKTHASAALSLVCHIQAAFPWQCTRYVRGWLEHQLTTQRPGVRMSGVLVFAMSMLRFLGCVQQMSSWQDRSSGLHLAEVRSLSWSVVKIVSVCRMTGCQPLPSRNLTNARYGV